MTLYETRGKSFLFGLRKKAARGDAEVKAASPFLSSIPRVCEHQPAAAASLLVTHPSSYQLPDHVLPRAPVGFNHTPLVVLPAAIAPQLREDQGKVEARRIPTRAGGSTGGMRSDPASAQIKLL